MKYFLFLVTLTLSFNAFANVFTRNYNSLEEEASTKDIERNRKKIENISAQISLFKYLIQKNRVLSIADFEEIFKNELVFEDPKYLFDDKDNTNILLESDLAQLEKQKRVLEHKLTSDGDQDCSYYLCKIIFTPDEEGFGGIALNPFGNGTEYKLNLLNYSIYLGDNFKVPFQLSFAEKSEGESTIAKNNSTLLDSNSGIAIQFPIAYRLTGLGNGVCHFEVKDGHCIVGYDITMRYIELEEELEGSDKTNKKGIFGMSAGIGASFIFPIFEESEPNNSGYFSMAMNARYYYHNSDDSSIFFGEMTSPDGNPIKFDNGFSALTITSEFALNKQFAIKAEYLLPFNNRNYLNEEFNVSFVLSGM